MTCCYRRHGDYGRAGGRKFFRVPILKSEKLWVVDLSAKIPNITLTFLFKIVCYVKKPSKVTPSDFDLKISRKSLHSWTSNYFLLFAILDILILHCK